MRPIKPNEYGWKSSRFWFIAFKKVKKICFWLLLEKSCFSLYSENFCKYQLVSNYPNLSSLRIFIEDEGIGFNPFRAESNKCFPVFSNIWWKILVSSGINEKITAQKIEYSIKDFFSKCDQIRSFLQFWSHLLKKSLVENFIFCAVHIQGLR